MQFPLLCSIVDMLQAPIHAADRETDFSQMDLIKSGIIFFNNRKLKYAIND